MVILTESPNVSTNIPKSKVKGEVNPKLCPKFNQDKNEIPAVAWAMKLPITIPANNSKNKAQLFFPALFAMISSFLYRSCVFLETCTCISKHVFDYNEF